ncbi:MAG: hypothetical protein ACR2KH_06625 [Sphingomicrobium sp.]
MATASQSTIGQSNSHSIHLTAELVHGEVKIRSDLKDTIGLPKDSGRHRFTFHLHDKTFPSMGVRFCTVAEGLLDIDESADCPPKNKGINTNQVNPSSVTSKDKMVAFTDKNNGPARTLSYALHFKCDDPAQKPMFDPEIRNGGGTTSMIGRTSAVVVALTVAAVAALIAVALWFK